jgi:hypothetical protein
LDFKKVLLRIKLLYTQTFFCSQLIFILIFKLRPGDDDGILELDAVDEAGWELGNLCVPDGDESGGAARSRQRLDDAAQLAPPVLCHQLTLTVPLHHRPEDTLFEIVALRKILILIFARSLKLCNNMLFTYL